MRCKACNSLLPDFNYRVKIKWDDLCGRCRSFVSKDLKEQEFVNSIKSESQDFYADEYEEEISLYDRNHDDYNYEEVDDEQ